MSDNEEDLELQALQRQLDDAFETTRPRTGFEDELWLRMQTSRPAPRRFADAFSALLQGIREVPAVPMAAVAAVLVVAGGIGVLAYGGVLGRGGRAGDPRLRPRGGGPGYPRGPRPLRPPPNPPFPRPPQSAPRAPGGPP